MSIPLTALQRDFLKFLDLYGHILHSEKIRAQVESDQLKAYELTEQCFELMKHYSNADRVITVALLAKLLIEDVEQFAELQGRPVC